VSWYNDLKHVMGWALDESTRRRKIAENRKKLKPRKRSRSHPLKPLDRHLTRAQRNRREKLLARPYRIQRLEAWKRAELARKAER